MNRALSLARIALAALFAAVPAASAHAEEAAPPRTLGRIERVDPRLDKLIPADATIEVLAEGFEWSEGPVWVGRPRRRADCLLFSDIPNNAVMKWKDGEGISVVPQARRLHRHRSAAAASRAPTACVSIGQGRLVLCQHGDRRVARARSATAAAPRWSTATRASGSTAPTTPSSSPTATCTSPIRPTAWPKRPSDPARRTRLLRRLSPLAPTAS